MLLALVALLAPRHAEAGKLRHGAAGLGLRGGRGEPDGWTYVPLLVGGDIALGAHGAFDTRLEVAAHYVAVRPGLALVACTERERQCISLGGSMGLASAAFATSDRAAALLFGTGASYRNRLGPTAYSLRVEGELIAARRGGAEEGWSRGFGMTIYVVRTL